MSKSKRGRIRPAIGVATLLILVTLVSIWFARLRAEVDQERKERELLAHLETRTAISNVVRTTIRQSSWLNMLLPDLGTDRVSGLSINANELVFNEELGKLQEFVYLRELEIDSPAFSDASVERFGALPNLQALRLVSTSVSNRGIAAIERCCPSLDTLALRGDSKGVSDSSAGKIAQLKHLKTLDVAGTSISYKGIEELVAKSGCTVIYVNDDQYSQEFTDRMKGVNPQVKLVPSL